MFATGKYDLFICQPDATHLSDRKTGEMQHYISQYVKEKRARHEWTKTSAKMPTTALRTLSDSFGKRPIAQFGPAAVDRWLASTANLAPSTRKNYANVVKAFARWLVHRGYLRRDPCVNMAKIKRPRTVVHVITPDEAKALWETCSSPRDRVMFSLMYMLGLRCVDCSRLNVDDWDRQNELMVVTGKGMHERFVPVPASLASLLRIHISAQPRSCGPLFPSSKGGRLTAQTISERMSRLMYEAGIKTGPRDGKSPHALRRTMATETLIASKDLRSTQNLLGHADLSSMRAYIARASVTEMAAAVRSRFPVEAA